MDVAKKIKKFYVYLIVFFYSLMISFGFNHPDVRKTLETLIVPSAMLAYLK